MGAWCGYGLGSECQDLPGFVVLNGGLIPPGGFDNFSSGLSAGQLSGLASSSPTIPRWSMSARRKRLPSCSRTSWRFCARSTRPAASAWGRATRSKSAIANYELAYRMQIGVPKLIDFADETPATLAAYGLDAQFDATADFRPAVPDRPAAGRTGRAVHRTDLPQRRRRSLGPTREV